MVPPPTLRRSATRPAVSGTHATPRGHLHATQHPQWTRQPIEGEEGAGMQISGTP